MNMKQDIFNQVSTYGIDTVSNAQLLQGIVGGTALSSLELKNVYDKSLDELMQLKGIGRKGAIAVKCAFELGKRYIQQCAISKPIRLDGSDEIYNFLSPYMLGVDHEEFWSVVLNNNLNPLRVKRMSKGGLTETAADIRLILREVLLAKGTALVVAHNHPSGCVLPSGIDDKLTSQIREACATMRITFVDHLIIGGIGGFYSYHDNGKI